MSARDPSQYIDRLLALRGAQCAAAMDPCCWIHQWWKSQPTRRTTRRMYPHMNRKWRTLPSSRRMAAVDQGTTWRAVRRSAHANARSPPSTFHRHRWRARRRWDGGDRKPTRHQSFAVGAERFHGRAPRCELPYVLCATDRIDDLHHPRRGPLCESLCARSGARFDPEVAPKWARHSRRHCSRSRGLPPCRARPWCSAFASTSCASWRGHRWPHRLAAQAFEGRQASPLRHHEGRRRY